MEKDVQFLDFVVKALVEHPEDVNITRTVAIYTLNVLIIIIIIVNCSNGSSPIIFLFYMILISEGSSDRRIINIKGM